MIILDTHALIWWINTPNKLSEKAKKKIQATIKSKDKILVSSISIWELYLLFKKGKLESDLDLDVWVQETESLPFFQFIPVNNSIAAKSVMLPNLHNDPADRIIVATSLEHRATLITGDRKLLNYKHIKSFW